jgi:hypothetical protein
MRRHATASLAALPADLRGLGDNRGYPVDISPALRRLAQQVDARTRP